MRKTTYAVIAVIIMIAVAGIVAGLYLTNNPAATSSSGLKVLATFYPLYDFAQNVGGDKINASILVPETVDVHDFEPTPSDIQNIATADVLIYNGAGFRKDLAFQRSQRFGQHKTNFSGHKPKYHASSSRATISKRQSYR